MAGVRCKACDHPKREEIDAAIVSDLVAERVIACEYGLTQQGLNRHKKHVAAALVEVQRTERREQDVRVFDGLQRIYTRMNLIIDACDRKLYNPTTGQYEVDPAVMGPLLKASAELRRTIESIAGFVVLIEAERQRQERAEDEAVRLDALFAETLGETLAADLTEWLAGQGVTRDVAALLAEQGAGDLLSRIVGRFVERTGG